MSASIGSLGKTGMSGPRTGQGDAAAYFIHTSDEKQLTADILALATKYGR